MAPASEPFVRRQVGRVEDRLREAGRLPCTPERIFAAVENEAPPRG